MHIHSDFDITVSKVLSAIRLYNHAFENPFHRRYRHHWAVALKSSGSTCYTSGGKQVRSDSTHAVILPMGSSYSWVCTEPGECLLIEFDAPQTCTEISSFHIADNSFFIRNFHRICKALSEDTPESRMAAFSLLYDTLRQLFKSAAKEYTPKDKQKLVKPAESYILENYADPNITNDYLASLCSISTVYFRRCFEAVFGVSPIRYLHDCRTKKAKDILGSDFESIEQVAESVGYNSVYHFSKMFKTYTGMSPSEYARSCRKA